MDRSLLDPDTPAEVEVRDSMAPPVTDPTVGTPLGRRTDVVAPTGPPRHPLVAVGDSLTHGVTSGAVHRTDLAWPAMVARALGVRPFPTTTYGGPLEGLPLNLEAVLRRLEHRLGDRLGPGDLLVLAPTLQAILDDNEDWWERGGGADTPTTGVRRPNLGVYGWDLRDALSFTAERALVRTGRRHRDQWTGVKPEGDNDIAAASVLGPFGDTATQLGAAARLGDDGGIGTLVVALGANNALDAVVSKQVRWSGPGYDDLDAKQAYNVWRPSHFRRELATVVRAVRTIRAERVLLATVPHVTIAPLARGVHPDAPGQKWRPGSRYYPYYTDPWIPDRRFRPDRHRHLTHAQARAVDSAVDQYNAAVADAVRAARTDGLDWYVLDLCGLLDGLARRRYGADPVAAETNGWTPYPMPTALADLDTRWFRSDRTGRLQGGLFGLDGIHPTTCGYGLVAHEVVQVLQRAAVPAAAGATVDLAAVRAADTLVSRPPALMAPVLDLLAPLAERLVSRRTLPPR